MLHSISSIRDDKKSKPVQVQSGCPIYTSFGLSLSHEGMDNGYKKKKKTWAKPNLNIFKRKKFINYNNNLKFKNNRKIKEKA